MWHLIAGLSQTLKNLLKNSHWFPLQNFDQNLLIPSKKIRNPWSSVGAVETICDAWHSCCSPKVEEFRTEVIKWQLWCWKWKIQDFRGGGAPNYSLAKFSSKLYDNEELEPRGEHASKLYSSNQTAIIINRYDRHFEIDLFENIYTIFWNAEDRKLLLITQNNPRTAPNPLPPRLKYFWVSEKSTFYRSGMVNSNTVNSKFHLIRSYCEYLARILSFHV